MKIGGVQKSLYNLLWSVASDYDITLCLFKKDGAYADALPESLKIIETPGLFRYLAVAQSECHGTDRIKRGFLAAFCRLFGRSRCMKFLLASERTLPEHYDCAIAFLHNGRDKSFYGGVQDYVLNRVNADRKIAFLHCDYRNCGANHAYNNRIIKEFDKIAACSDGCRQAFEAVLPELAPKCMTVRNFHRFDEIRALGEREPIVYDTGFVNIVSVSRLSQEKGIERAILAVSEAVRKGFHVRLHIVGDGAKGSELREMAKTMGVSDSVIFYGEQTNPYRYMKHADLLMLTSYHEAAPMVIEEARALALPILTTEFTSSKDMVIDMKCGWVCENTQSAINKALDSIVQNRKELADLKAELKEWSFDNSIAKMQFGEAVE